MTGAPSTAELEALFVQKYGRPEDTGWAPRRRFEFGYYSPADVYECLVSKHIADGSVWLDVGGGRAIFPDNSSLTRTLTSRCKRVIAIDPSDNVRQNQFVDERVQAYLEEYDPLESFDVVTMRMVVEHVAEPEAFVQALSRLVRPGGAAIVLTVNRWSPLSLLSSLLPFRFHHSIKRRFWGGSAEDTFPVQYKMNTPRILRDLFVPAGFTEELFVKTDDLSLFGKFRRLNLVELMLWRGLKALRLGYPENCLLAVYRRRGSPTDPRLPHRCPASYS